jgi:hypothetical protein
VRLGKRALYPQREITMAEAKEFITVGEEFWVESLGSTTRLIQFYSAMVADRIEFDEAAKKMKILEAPLSKKLADKERTELVSIVCSRATGILQRDANEEAELEEEEKEDLQNLLDKLIADHFSSWIFLSLAKSVRTKSKKKRK